MSEGPFAVRIQWAPPRSYLLPELLKPHWSSDPSPRITSCVDSLPNELHLPDPRPLPETSWKQKSVVWLLSSKGEKISAPQDSESAIFLEHFKSQILTDLLIMILNECSFFFFDFFFFFFFFLVEFCFLGPLSCSGGGWGLELRA